MEASLLIKLKSGNLMTIDKFRDKSGKMEKIQGIREFYQGILLSFNTLAARLDGLMGCKSTQPDNQGKTPWLLGYVDLFGLQVHINQ